MPDSERIRKFSEKYGIPEELVYDQIGPYKELDNPDEAEKLFDLVTNGSYMSWNDWEYRIEQSSESLNLDDAKELFDDLADRAIIGRHYREDRTFYSPDLSSVVDEELGVFEEPDIDDLEQVAKQNDMDKEKFVRRFFNETSSIPEMLET